MAKEVNKSKPETQDQDKQFKSGKADNKLGKLDMNKIKEENNPKWKSSKEKKFKGKKFERKKTNDPNWYVANPSIVKDVANLPFAVFNGLSYNCFKQVETINTLPGDSIAPTTAPGVAVYKYMPWFGTATPTSALNLTMRALYSFVRHANSGRANYEAPDLMLYLMAMDSIYLVIHEVKRLLRLAYLYVLENRDIPSKIYDTLGIDITDVVSNLANYRAQLNIRIAKANSLAVPANFNLFKRRAVMGSVVLTDEPNRPTQLIIPQSDGYYIYDPTKLTGGSLQYIAPDMENFGAETKYDNCITATAYEKVTLNDYFKLMDKMLSVLLSDEDINIMSGDIIKAYGADLYSLPFLADNEIQEIIHDENLLLQFTNSTVLDVLNATFNFRGADEQPNSIQFKVGYSVTDSPRPVISQKDGSLVAKCVTNVAGLYNSEISSTLGQKPFVMLDTQFVETSDSNSITPENVLEWTRLMMTSRKDNESSDNYIIEAGVELGLGWLVATPSIYWNLTQKQKDNDVKTIVNQWFQFGEVIMLGNRRNYPVMEGLVEAYSYTYYTVFASSDQREVLPSENYITRFNCPYSDRFMNGLSFGPRSYLAGHVAVVPQTKLYIVYVDGSIGKMYEKTALANRDNITAMHDAALLGLISSPYISHSK